MPIFNTIIFFLCIYGASTILSTEYIFQWFRAKTVNIPWLYTLVNCNKCLSVWLAFLVSLNGWGVLSPFIDAMCAYAVTKMLNAVVDLLEELTEYIS